MPLEIISAIVEQCSISTTTNPSIKLVEAKNKSKPNTLSQVTIEKAHDSVWFSVDRKKKWSSYLADAQGIQKRCDYVIINAVDGTTTILFVELKSANIEKDELYEKFRAKECFIDYCDSIARKFFGRSITKGCKKRFVVFYLAPSIAKTPTRPITSNYDRPNNPRYFPNPNRPKLKQLI
ncbi:MAG: hypothetical protein H8D56_27025 [Planctomycetes bacterium]|nr:hypothetical protein [Planctomycetota bacterium]